MRPIEFLMHLIGLVESGLTAHAIRFEEHLYRKYKQRHVKVGLIASYNGFCSNDTAYMIACSSWGMYQILGWNLYYMCNLQVSIGEYLNDVSLQNETFKNFFKAIMNVSDIDFCAEKIIWQLKGIEWQIRNKDINTVLNIIQENKDKMPHLVKFIRRYNGCQFGSIRFADYLLRMCHYIKINVEEGEKHGEKQGN